MNLFLFIYLQNIGGNTKILSESFKMRTETLMKLYKKLKSGRKFVEMTF